MFRNLGYRWLVASVLASMAIGPTGYAQEKERSLVHRFDIMGDPELVKSFAKAYVEDYKSLKLSEYCGSTPAVSGKEDRVSITCKPSTSTAVITDMARVFQEATKGQKAQSTLTMVISA